MKNIYLLTIAVFLNSLWLAAQTPCANLVSNGNFETSTNITSGYTASCACANSTYCINTNANLKCASLGSITDHTSGSGRFLIVQGAGSAVTNTWSTNVTVTPNTPYTYSFWARGINPLPTILAMMVNNVNVGQFTLSVTSGVWTQYTFSGTTPAGVTSLPIAIRQITFGEIYNYGIDDIEFKSCAEPPCLACSTGVATTNLVSNGSFTNGNTGFTSGLNFSTGCGTGSYGIATDFPTFCSGWGPLSPRSGPNFLALDGDANPAIPTVLWQTPVTLTPQTDYCFSFYWALAFAHPSQNFPISIDIVNSAGVVVANANAHVGDLTVATNLNWTQKIATWSSGSLTGAHFIAIRQLTGSIYRDWAIDDICFTAKPPTPCDAAFTSAAIGTCGNYQFTNTSTGTGLTYFWIFGDPNSGGNNSTAGQSPTHQFSTCGSYIVRLIIAGPDCRDTAFQTINYAETTPPIITNCPTNLTVNTNQGQCYYTFPTLPAITATDNCDPNPSISYSYINSLGITLPFTTATQFPKGINFIKITAKDACNNVSRDCAFTLTVVDNEKPKIICPLSITAVGTITPPSAQCKAIVNGLAPTVTDNCTMWTIGYTVTGATTASGVTDASGTMFLQGVSTVTYVVTDMAGNKDSCKFTITVNCEPPPINKAAACGWSVATCWSPSPSGPVAVLYDTRLNMAAPIGGDWGAATPPVPSTHPVGWTRGNIGNVFGIALDNTSGNIYLAATDVYRYDNAFLGSAVGTLGGGTAGVYLTNFNTLATTTTIVNTTAAPLTVSISGNSLPNTGGIGNGIGNIAYDRTNNHNQMFLTNLEDGRIYRVSPTGTLLSAYDPFGLDVWSPGLAAAQERIWGIGVNVEAGITKVYFAREGSTSANKQIWSIALTPAGEFSATPLSITDGFIHWKCRTRDYNLYPRYSTEIDRYCFFAKWTAYAFGRTRCATYGKGIGV
jgi:PKD repeat protein